MVSVWYSLVVRLIFSRFLVSYRTLAASARERSDLHFEAVASTVLAQALRLSRRFEAAAEQLKVALGYAEGLGYSHVLCSALRQV